MYKPKWSKQAEKDKDAIEEAGLKKHVAKIVGVVKRNPYERTPGHNFEKLKGYDPPTYTRRINRHHRFVYHVNPNVAGEIDPKTGKPFDGIVRIIRLWGHFP